MRSRGFTIIEFAVTLAIVGILVSMALPNLMSMLANSQLRSTSSELHAALSTARAEALRSRTAVTFCARTGTACASASTESSSWADGWIVFIDRNSDGTVNSDEKIVNEYGKLSAGVTLAGTNRIRFFSSGTADTNATLSIKKEGATTGREISIAIGGKAITKQVEP